MTRTVIHEVGSSRPGHLPEVVLPTPYLVDFNVRMCDEGRGTQTFHLSRNVSNFRWPLGWGRSSFAGASVVAVPKLAQSTEPKRN